MWLASHPSGERRVFKFCFDAARVRALKREVTLFRLLEDSLGDRDDLSRILDWQFDEPPYFLEAEYTEGGSLVAWAEQQGGLAEVPLETRLELVAEVAEALGAAHSVGILHKDVKPENVLITTDRSGCFRARLTDFGIGLLIERERLDNPGFTAMGFTRGSKLTEASGSGTIGYLAPELLEGKAATVQADLYSLGVLLYQVVVADLTRTLAPGWERDIADPILAEDIRQLVDGAPERRPSSAAEVSRRLRTLDNRRRTRTAEEARQRALQQAQRRRKLASVTASVLFVVLAIVAYMGFRESQAREAAVVRRQQAENLVGFMVGDLHDKLQAVGRLDILDDVGDEMMRYFDLVSEDEPSAEELLQHHDALNQIGLARLSRGDLEGAHAAYESALKHSSSKPAVN